MVTQSASEHKKKVVKKRPFKNQGTCDGAFTYNVNISTNYINLNQLESFRVVDKIQIK